MKKDIVIKWYALLRFPAEYDEEFQRALLAFDCEKFTNVDEYIQEKHSPQENLLAFLYFCEELQRRYAEKHIPENILFDTLHDLVVWTNVYYSTAQEVGLAETSWLKSHLQMKLFQIGRLQYCIKGSYHEVPEVGVRHGDNVVQVHIPSGEPLRVEKCRESLRQAEAFIREYFPDYSYEYYTCHSWLLNKHLLELVGENSNIALFQSLFHLSISNESDSILKYVFQWNARRDNLQSFVPRSSLAKKLQEKAAQGGVFYETVGYIPRTEIHE